ncbi:glycosyltransferase family 4 protein [Flavobacterium sp. U410]
MTKKTKLIRITTVPVSLDKLLEGQLGYMNQFYEVIAISSDIQYLQEIAEKENVRFLSVEMTRKITPLKDIIAVYRLYKIFRQEKPEIVHTHTPKAGIVGMLAAKLAGVPLRFHTVAGLPLMEARGIKRGILNFVEKLTYFCATKVYPNSKGLYDFILAEKFTSSSKLKVLGNGSSNGIKTEYFKHENISQQEKVILKEKLAIEEQDFVFIYVGRLVKDKGINELTKAFSDFTKGYTNTKLLLVGDFEMELDPLLPETILEINNNPKIIAVGFQKDVRPYFSISNALVFPSYREGFPNVVMQAGAMNLPSIVTNINGCNEIIVENKNGIIIPVKNTIAIFEVMRKIISDKEYYEKLKNNSRKMILERYDQQLVWQAILNEYKEQRRNV